MDNKTICNVIGHIPSVIIMAQVMMDVNNVKSGFGLEDIEE